MNYMKLSKEEMKRKRENKYSVPERLNRNKIFEKHIWTFGCILYENLSGGDRFFTS